MMNPEITVCVTTAPISSLPLPSRSDCGAVLDFFGVVRGEEKGEQIAGLEYEAYQPMAERQIEQIIRALLDQFPCRAVDVVHRIGFIAVGESSIVVRVASPHRQEAIAFLAEFMNRLKEDVPIWKKPSPSNARQS
ncbi:MAG: molybdenum cofactor biosynthesis protein MoaE [Chthoniobacterales bacterium]